MISEHYVVSKGNLGVPSAESSRSVREFIQLHHESIYFLLIVLKSSIPL